MVRLIIAEKPSLAREIAAALGVTNRRDGFIAGEKDYVTWCFGHLIELSPMDAYDPKLKAWTATDLPFIPTEFRYRVNEGTKSQFEIIKQLIHDPAVTSVVNACDAGREGELIFSLVFVLAGVSHKPVSRLWVSDLTATAFRDGFTRLRPASEYQGLRDAAHARQQADWVIGLNATRAQTLIARSQGGTGVYSLGRVQTPTLALIAERDLAIENFRPANYFQVKARFATVPINGETYEGWWFKGTNPNGAVIGRFDSVAPAAQFCRRLMDEAKAAATRPQVASVTRKEIAAHAPLLYDLTQLQRTANRRFGLTSARTLEIAQTLYERKLLTYPRTSSQYLTTALNEQIINHLKPLASLTGELSHYARWSNQVINAAWTLTPRHVNDAKVTDHHALIPTTQALVSQAALAADEMAVYDLVVRRFLAAFFPDASDARTEIVTQVGSESFLTRGTRELSAGWRAVDPTTADRVALADGEDGSKGADDVEEGGLTLPDVAQGATVSAQSIEAAAKQSRAPARFTEDTLLAAMETAGAIIEDAEVRDAMKENGLGMPATRAAMIEKLIERSYIVREKKKFVRATAVGREIIARLRRVNSVLASPALTGEWEKALSRIERGEFTREQFTQAVNALTIETVTQIFAQSSSASAPAGSSGVDSSFAEAEGALLCPNCARAGRTGSFLRVRAGQYGKFLGCTATREVCGYMSDVPKTKGQTKALIESKCPTCSGVMRLKFGKDTQQPFLTCVKYPECRGVQWLDSKKKPAKATLKKG